MRTKQGNKEEAILTAAVKVFAESGYHAAKIHSIADEAGIAAGSIYSYFENKQQIILALFDDVWKELYEQISPVEKDNTLTADAKFDMLIDIVIDVFTVDRNLALVVVNEESHLIRDYPEEFTPYFEKFMKSGEAIVKEGVIKRQFRSDIKIDLLRILILGQIRSLLLTWAIGDKKISIQAMKEDLKKFIKCGINRV